MAKKYNSNKLHPLVAVELCSDSLRAMAAEYTADGALRILGVETSNKVCVERGVVNNTSNASYGVNEMLRLLANRVHCGEILKAFIPLGNNTPQR